MYDPDIPVLDLRRYTKLLLRLRQLVKTAGSMAAEDINMACVDAMLYLAGIVRLGESDKV